MFIAQLGLIVSTLVSVSAGNSLLRTVKEQQLQSHVRQDMSLQAASDPWFTVTSYATAGTGAVTYASPTVSVAAGAACTGAINPVKTSYQLGVCVVTTPSVSGDGTLGTAYKYLLSAASTLPVLKYTYRFNFASTTPCGAGTIGTPDYTCNGDSAAVSGNCVRDTQVAELNCLNTAAYTYVGPAVTYVAPKSEVAVMSAAAVYGAYNEITYSDAAACTAGTAAKLFSVDSATTSAGLLDTTSCVFVTVTGGTGYAYKMVSMSGSSVTINKWTAASGTAPPAACDTTTTSGTTYAANTVITNNGCLGNVKYSTTLTNPTWLVSSTAATPGTAPSTACTAAPLSVAKTTYKVGVCVTTSGTSYQYKYDTTDDATAKAYKYIYTDVACTAGETKVTSPATSAAYLGPKTCAGTYDAANLDKVVEAAAAANFNTYNKVTFSGTCTTSGTITMADVLQVDSSATLDTTLLDTSTTCISVAAVANGAAAYWYRINGCSGSFVTITKYTATGCTGTATVTAIPACDPLFGAKVRYICPVLTFSVTKDFVETGNTCTNLESASTYAVGQCIKTGATSYKYAAVAAFTTTNSVVTAVYTYSKLAYAAENAVCSSASPTSTAAADVACTGGETITVPVVAGSTPVYSTYNKVTYTDDKACSASTATSIVTLDSSVALDKLNPSACTLSGTVGLYYKFVSIVGSQVTVSQWTTDACTTPHTTASAVYESCGAFFGNTVRFQGPKGLWAPALTYADADTTCAKTATSTFSTLVDTCLPTGTAGNTAYAKYYITAVAVTSPYASTYSYNTFSDSACSANGQTAVPLPIACASGKKTLAAAATPVYSTYNFVTYTDSAACSASTAASIVTVDASPTLDTTCYDSGTANLYFKIVSIVGSQVTISQWTNNLCTTPHATPSAVIAPCAAFFGTTVRFQAPAAVVVPAASSSSDDKVCFAGSEIVSLEDGSSKQISEVEIGDRILSADLDGTTGFSSVIALAHPKNDILTTFVHIETASADLKVTPDHLLLASADCTSMKLTAAAAVTVDSCILTINGPARVEATSEIVEAGIYSVVTEKELIVVNGIVASPFAVNHAVANKYYDIHRVLFALFPGALTSSVFKTIHFGISAFVGSL